MKTMSSFMKWAFTLAFVIITNLFFYYSISFVSPSPKFSDFCPLPSAEYITAETCVDAGGQWQNYNYSPKVITEAVQNGEPIGWCNPNYTCEQEYNSVSSIYNKNVFIVMIVISVAMVVGGVLVSSVEVLSSGMVWSGVLALLIATIRFWSDATSLMKLIILAVGIAVLVWLAVKKMNHKEKENDK